MAGGMKGIPDGASVVIPRLFCRDVAAAIDFCKNTFDAVERVRRPGPDGTVAHALMTITRYADVGITHIMPPS
jgi:PhnB protein